MSATPGGLDAPVDPAATGRQCWLCDGRVKEPDGITVESLGGVVVHARCLPDLNGTTET